MLCLWKHMTDKIILSRNHLPLLKEWMINNQTQYETAQFLMMQERLGFNPSYLVTFHYYHPDEVKKKQLVCKPGKNEFNHHLWNEKPKDKFARKRILDEDALIEDHQQIRNVILRDLYGIKRLNQTWKKEKFPHTLFVYEKGKSKVKYHTHLFLENKNLKYDTIEELDFVFNNKIRKKRRCFSNWKKIHIERVFSVKGALSYCNKETNSSNYSIDYQTSNLIHQYAN